MTTYANYQKQSFPTGRRFNRKQEKLIEAAQCGIGDETALRKAVTNAAAGDLILLAPCTITLTQQLSITKPLRFKGSCLAGTAGTKLSGTTSGSMVNVEMSTANGAAACELTFEDISFQHTTDAVDVFDINNTNMAAALYVRFRNCNINTKAASASWALDVAHATAGQAIVLEVRGGYSNTVDAINATIANAADRITVEGMTMQKQGKSAALTTSSGAVAAQLKLVRCQVPATAGAVGGHASQLLISVGCISLTGTTYAAASGTTDYTGSHTETVL